MDWIQIFIIIAFLCAFIFLQIHMMKSDIERLDIQIESCRQDTRYAHEEIDRLRQMFFDLHKEGK